MTNPDPKIVSQPSNQNYRDGWDRLWGIPERKEWGEMIMQETEQRQNQQITEQYKQPQSNRNGDGFFVYRLLSHGVSEVTMNYVHCELDKGSDVTISATKGREPWNQPSQH